MPRIGINFELSFGMMKQLRDYLFYGLAVGLVWMGLSLLAGFVRKPVFLREELGFTYEMGIPKDNERMLDLSGHRVERDYKSFPELANQQNTIYKAGPAQPLATHKDTQLNAAGPAGKVPSQAGAAAKKNQKKNKVEVRTVDTDRGSQGKGTDTDSRVQVEMQEVEQVLTPNNGLGISQQQQPEAVTEEKAEDEAKFSGAQWRAKLQAEPTMQQAQAVVQAYLKGHFSSKDFYLIVADQLESSNESQQKIGLFLLNATPSVASFEFAVTNSAKLSGNVAQNLDREIAQYGENGNRWSVLNEVLRKSEDSVVLSEALDVLGDAIAKTKPAGAPQQRGQPRTQQANANSANRLLGFVSALTQLSQTDADGMSGRAQTLIASIRDKQFSSTASQQE